MAGRKLFVGSLPFGIQDSQLRAEFGKYGQLEDVFVKQGCDPSRQWAFVTYLTAEDAQRAKDATDRILQFPGVDRPCDVMVAKHQGMFGQDPIHGGSPTSYNGGGMSYGGGHGGHQAVEAAPKKVFVGSLPETITDIELRAEFSKYGQILDLFLNTKPVEAGRQWAFITFANSDQAQNAKVNADRILVFPGSDKACEVTLARHQGMFGKEPMTDSRAPGAGGYGAPVAYAAPVQGPRKIFVGSLPPDVNDAVLTAEFSKYGQVVDVHMNNKPCDPGRNWAFITFASSEQAAYAKESTDRALIFPGSDRACEVMFSKNQGKFGQEPLNNAPMQSMPTTGYVQQPAMVSHGHGQPPPPVTPPPQHLTPWRMYKTAAGLPYYHNHTTGATQWECPPELQVVASQNRYSPY